MKPVLRCFACLRIGRALAVFLLLTATLRAEPLPLRRAVELALSHSTTAAVAGANERHALASYHEVRNQYLPQFIVGSGLGASWGFPLSLEGSAPAIFNVNAQSALFNPALRDFVRAAKTDWRASVTLSKDQRNQVIQETVLGYAELAKWEDVLRRLQEEEAAALKAEANEEERVREGVDNPLERNKAKLATARVRYWMAEAQGAADVLRNRLSQLTGLVASAIETVPDSIPELPEAKQDRDADVASKAALSDPTVQAAQQRAEAQRLRARGEHRGLWPMVDFAAQYAVLAQYNNYADFFKTFQRNNATVGVAIRFPFLNPSQHAHAQVADADALRARKEAEATKNRVSEATLKLQRAVSQLSAARDVADLEYQIAQSSFDAVQTRINSGTGNLHDLEDARTQVNNRYRALQDANFELQRARISLLRATGGLESWVMGTP
jgi:outer membrane protein TolC